MASTISEQYPRTLYLWTKSDDKKLSAAVQAGESLLVLAEELQREHMTVVHRLCEMDLFQFDRGTEEWVEVMTLALGGAPLNAVLDWCNGADARLPYAQIEESLMGDFRSEFELARELGIDVPSIEAIADLTWLLQQPQDIRNGYRNAAAAIMNRFDVLTPATLKAQVLGLVPATAPWPMVLESRPARKRRATRTKSAGTKTYRRRTSTATGYAKRGSKRKTTRRGTYRS